MAGDARSGWTHWQFKHLGIEKYSRDGDSDRISDKQMKNIAAQIAGNHRQSRNPQRLVEKRNHRFGFKMMTKQIAANHIEAAVREGQSKRVTGDSIQIQIVSIHVRNGPIQNG